MAAMRRTRLAAILMTLASSATAAPKRKAPPPPPVKQLLEAPEFTIRPQGAQAGFTGETVNVTVGWRPVIGAAKYRLTIIADNQQSTDIETTELRHELSELHPGKYQFVVTALDASQTPGAPSDPLPVNVIEIHAIPPGAAESMAPQRGAYAVGTRFSVTGMHCEFSDAPIDDLLVGAENEIRMPVAGLATLRCAGIPGYLERRVVIAPVNVDVTTPATKGATSQVRVTIASVAYLGDHLTVQGIGDLSVGDTHRTDLGLEVPVHVAAGATTAALSVQTQDFELGRAKLSLIDAPLPPPPPPRPPYEWNAFDLGGHAGAFVPSDGRHAPTIGHPSDPADAMGAGPLVGVRLGFFPTRRVGLEGETTLIEAGHGEREGASHLLAGRLQLAVRALEGGALGLRLIGGIGTFTNLTQTGTAQPGTQGEVHGGAAFTIETSPNLWLRFQIVDAVTSARDDGYSHNLELELGVVTRVGRRDSW